MIRMIAAIGSNNEIGRDNKLLWNIPEEMKIFIAHTEHRTVLMGRNTFESIGKPLPNRTNIVISTTVSSIAGTVVYSTIEQALIEHPDVVIIGGEQIYRACMPYADELIISHIPISFLGADAYFPTFANEFTQRTLIDNSTPYFTSYKYTKPKEKNNEIQVKPA
jgi:dihydrofolate reductase